MAQDSSKNGSEWREVVTRFADLSHRYPLIVIIGPTASGKTAFSIQLAHFLKNELGRSAEVINADSRQLYRGLNIGTAKITAPEMHGVPHHLLSVLDPREPATIAWYLEQAARVIAEVQSRGAIPVLVGGSMLYVSAIVDGLKPIAPADPVIRERLFKEYDQDQGVTLFERLTKIDPETAATIPRQNKNYVVRALEIYESTGKPKSAQQRSSPSPYDLLIFGMDIERDELKRRIDARTRSMLEHGWIDEVQRLIKSGYSADDPGLHSHGYREIMAFITSGGTDLESLGRAISARVRQYAKRHVTWWRGDERVVWVRV